jgi:hypothetical protein
VREFPRPTLKAHAAAAGSRMTASRPVHDAAPAAPNTSCSLGVGQNFTQPDVDFSDPVACLQQAVLVYCEFQQHHRNSGCALWFFCAELDIHQ